MQAQNEYQTWGWKKSQRWSGWAVAGVIRDVKRLRHCQLCRRPLPLGRVIREVQKEKHAR